MKYLFFLLLFTFTCCCFTSAQTEKSVAEEELDRNTFGNPYSASHQNYYRGKPGKFTGGEESFFINKKWTSLKVIDKEDKEVTIEAANYLIEKRIMLFKKGEERFQIYPHTVKMLILGDQIFKAYPSVNKKNEGILEFYEVLVAGNLELIKVWDLNEVAISNNPMGINDTNKTELKRSSKLYYKKGKQRRLKRLPKKKADRLTIFGSKKKKVMDYAKKHSLSVKKEEDLKSLITFYNSQMSLEDKE